MKREPTAIEQLYIEMHDRMSFLESLEQTDEVEYRIMELRLCIARTQQLLIESMPSMPVAYHVATTNCDWVSETIS